MNYQVTNTFSVANYVHSLCPATQKRRNEDKLNQNFVFPVEQKAVLSGEEQERKITTYEEAMNKIKDTTGVSDIKEVVQRFLSQGETQKHLEQLKTNNEKMLVRLKEDKVQNYCPFLLFFFCCYFLN